MTDDSEKEDIEASEAADIERLERPMSALWASMTTFRRDSDAWIDFVAAMKERLHLVPEARDVGVPQNFWHYWTAVADGISTDYDADGARLRTL